ncbi:MAG: permease, partial [Chlorobiales bacterium]|nr:permease [Chlorobiales bacterium]
MWLRYAVVSAGLLFLYGYLELLAELIVGLLGLSRDNHFGEAFYFFVYEVPKVLLLLVGVVFVMGVVHTFVSPEKTRAMLSGKRTGAG